MRFLQILLVILLSSCSISLSNKSEGEKSPSNSIDSKYFLYGTNIDYDKIKNHFIFYDENYNILNEIEYETKFDIFYSELNGITQIFYMFGNGGLFEIDLSNSKVNKINDFPITSIAFKEKSLYYYINGGYTETGYDSKICNVDNACLTLSNYVYDFTFINNRLYVACDSDYFGQYKLKIFENNKEIHEYDLRYNINSFKEISKISYGLNPYGMYELDSNNFIKYYLNGSEHYIAATDPLIKEVNNKIYIVDNDSSRLYEAQFNSERIELNIVYEFDKYYFVYPSLDENRIVLVSNEKSIEIFDFETMDIEIVDIDLANDIDFFHAIEMEN